MEKHGFIMEKNIKILKLIFGQKKKLINMANSINMGQQYTKICRNATFSVRYISKKVDLLIFS